MGVRAGSPGGNTWAKPWPTTCRVRPGEEQKGHSHGERDCRIRDCDRNGKRQEGTGVEYERNFGFILRVTWSSWKSQNRKLTKLDLCSDRSQVWLLVGSHSGAATTVGSLENGKPVRAPRHTPRQEKVVAWTRTLVTLRMERLDARGYGCRFGDWLGIKWPTDWDLGIPFSLSFSLSPFLSFLKKIF